MNIKPWVIRGSILGILVCFEGVAIFKFFKGLSLEKRKGHKRVKSPGHITKIFGLLFIALAYCLWTWVTTFANLQSEINQGSGRHECSLCCRFVAVAIPISWRILLS